MTAGEMTDMLTLRIRGSETLQDLTRIARHGGR